MALPGTQEGAIPASPDADALAAQAEKILASPLFASSGPSRALLLYLLEWVRLHPGEQLKESELAVAVFHRQPANFDSQTDSVVRVQMARLRSKLHQYYLSDGQSDPVLLDVPKGAYRLVGTYRTSSPLPPVREFDELPLEPPAPAALPAPAPAAHPWRLLLVGLLGLLLGASFTAWWLWPASSQRVAAPLRQFWTAVLPPGSPNLIVFSNPHLAGKLAYEGLHYFRDGIDTAVPGAENLSYAGAGDVTAVHRLTRLFDQLQQAANVRSGALLSWDQAKDANLIFLGRPEQNPALRQLPRLREFYFKFQTGIVNAHPQPGEQAIYACSERPYTRDYAIIAYVPGLNSNRRTLILAGNTTYGSQAAAEFVSNEAALRTLLAKLNVPPSGTLPFFEALIDVRINRETPVWSQLLAVRTLTEEHGTWSEPTPDER